MYFCFDLVSHSSRNCRVQRTLTFRAPTTWQRPTARIPLADLASVAAPGKLSTLQNHELQTVSSTKLDDKQ